MTRLRRILFATDFSTASRRAFTTAMSLTRATGARLTIVSVIFPVMPAVPEVYLDAATTDRLDKQSRDWATRELRRLQARAKRAGVDAAIRLRRGDPANEILRAQRAERADLLILGTHGRRGLSRLVLGSVAQRVMATARCPVVTVRSPAR